MIGSELCVTEQSSNREPENLEAGVYNIHIEPGRGRGEELGLLFFRREDVESKSGGSEGELNAKSYVCLKMTPIGHQVPNLSDRR